MLVLFFGFYLSPLITALVFAFVLHPIVGYLERLYLPHFLAVLVVVLLFVGALFALLAGILPVVFTQIQQAVANTPTILARTQVILQEFSSEYLTVLPTDQLQKLVDTVLTRLADLGGLTAQNMLSHLQDVVIILVFIVLVPVCLFFVLLDYKLLISWFQSFLPEERDSLVAVGNQMNKQLARYVRGKAVEILIVGLVSYFVFLIFGLQYPELLALLMGLSVLVPFVGAALVTIPVFLVAATQFGWSLELVWVMVAYAIIQIVDGNVLVPFLFSQTNKLHPIAIIAAVLGFGGLFGIWGVFFAIPLATLIKTLIEVWPVNTQTESGATSGA